MQVKLNLSINEETAKRIKSYAEKNTTSVSKIAEEHFDKLTTRTKRAGKTFTEKYAGTLKHHIGDVDKAKDDYLKQKH
jgi:hypothetical protein